jgi:hypothetical protein
MKTVFLKVSIVTLFTAFITFDSHALDESQEVLTSVSGGAGLYNNKGEVLQVFKHQGADDIQRMHNGNFLFTSNHSGIFECDSSGKVVWSFEMKGEKGGGIMSCKPLKDGTFLASYNSEGQIVIINREGKFIKTIQLPNITKGSHGNMRDIKQLKNGNYLVCQKGLGLNEFDDKGNLVWGIKKPGFTFYVAYETDHNTFIVTALSCVAEIDRDSKKVLWKMTTDELKKELNCEHIGVMCGLSIMKNGNYMISFYKPYDKKTKKGYGMVEINRDKKVVWKYPEDGKIHPGITAHSYLSNLIIDKKEVAGK